MRENEPSILSFMSPNDPQQPIPLQKLTSSLISEEVTTPPDYIVLE